MSEKSTFIRITNAEIYQMLCKIEKQLMTMNGKVRLNKWIATTALTCILGLAGYGLYKLFL